jgi:hypothetical protein
MSMRLRLARLFTIKTRTEAFLVTYAIAVGAIERGFHYMQDYPGYGGIMLALACLGVPFIAGAKLVDSVKPQVEAPMRQARPARASRRVSRSRPKLSRRGRGSVLRFSRRTD